MRLQIRSSAEDAQQVIEAWAETIEDWSLPTRPPQEGAISWDGRSLWDRLDETWRASRRALFDTFGVSEGVRWPEYSETEEADVYRYAKAAILGLPLGVIEQDRLRWGGPNRLMLSMIGESSEYVYTFNATTMEVGTEVGYAINHDLGIGEGPVWGGAAPVPRRQLRVVGPATLAEIEEHLVDYAAERLDELAGEIRTYTGAEALAIMGVR